MKYVLLLFCCVLLNCESVTDSDMRKCRDVCVNNGGLYAVFGYPMDHIVNLETGKKLFRCECYPEIGQKFYIHFDRKEKK